VDSTAHPPQITEANLMKRVLLAVLIVPMMLVSACVPIHVVWTDWPDVDGKAVDVVTGKPVAGAAVAIHAATADFSANTVTGADGTFHFAEHTHDQWTSYQFNNVFPPAMLSITAPGYSHFENKLDGSMFLDAIPLTPVR
jgi:hypothetical protein